MKRPTITVTVTDEDNVTVHSETRHAWNAAILASTAAVREIARAEGVMYTGLLPVREGERNRVGDTYQRVWMSPKGVPLLATVRLTEDPYA